MDPIRIGIVGLGRNTRSRHVPGFQACEKVELIAVCNRRPESTQQVALEFDIPKTFDDWEQLVADDDVDAVMIGTWPYLHCPITLAALENGKHVLTEARMAVDLTEARRMFAAAQQHPELVTQIVPSPFGLRAGKLIQELLQNGYLGDLREFVVLGTNSELADSQTPLHWRQAARYSGLNMLTLGILHETLIRWLPDPIRVLASTQTFTDRRPDPDGANVAAVDRPDSVQVLTELPDGARGMYHLSGVLHHGPGFQIHLYGSEGTLRYYLGSEDRLLGARKDDTQLSEIRVPPEKQDAWRVETDFIDAIRGGPRPTLTDFATGVRYMEFTEAVQRSADAGTQVSLPLGE
jgi:predicted dehydrogenase